MPATPPVLHAAEAGLGHGRYHLDLLIFRAAVLRAGPDRPDRALPRPGLPAPCRRIEADHLYAAVGQLPFERLGQGRGWRPAPVISSSGGQVPRIEVRNRTPSTSTNRIVASSGVSADTGDVPPQR